MSCWTKLAFAALTLAALSVATPAATANPHARGGHYHGGYYGGYRGVYYRPYYGGYYGGYGYGYGYPAVGVGVIIAPRPIIVNQQPVIVAQPILPIQPVPQQPFAGPLQQQPGQLRVAPVPVPNFPNVPPVP
jgi:hypothetical protein